MAGSRYPYKPDPKPKEKDNSWLWVIGIILGLIFIPKACNFFGEGGSSGTYYPFDNSSEESYDIQAEINEGRQEEAEIIKKVGKGCYEDMLAGVPDEYSRCGGDGSKSPSNEYGEWEHEDGESEITSSCPLGCTEHISGCDIKGNISQNNGSKIYHVPGQEYYSSTKISPDYGERWFCTEQEAVDNGWRKAIN